ncbi:MAG: DNA helicase II [Alphaproteobacteria bacterium]|nr:MAG: DNA helicase II [Alphaproteobacteria bacterium]
MDYLETLNPAQREAVEHTDGPLLVLAGAGTGKTRVLTTRLAHILSLYKATPGEILSVTFTNKAAIEMRERVSNLMGGQPVEGWWLGTFHALAGRMLRQHADLVGLSSNYTIIDPDDSVRLVKQLMENANIDIKKTPPKLVRGLIDRWKDRGLTPDKVTAEEAGLVANGKAIQIYKNYQSRLQTLNACDFGDLLLHMIVIFQNPLHADILEQYHRRFRYIMVDEYQDTNVAQYLWLRLLAKKSQNICVVGDDDQSIYGWRGAEVENILRFEKDFEGAKIIRLEDNYRSTQNILTAADGVIANNSNRLGKTLKSTKGIGDKVIVHGLWDGASEARWVGEHIEQLQRQKISNKEIAVLVRAGFQMREFEERFMTLGLPYRVVGGPRFYERMEVRDALAYLRVTAQPHDDLALERVINTPKRGLGNTTIERLYAHARTLNISLSDAILQLCETDELKPKQRATLRTLMDDFQKWRDAIPSTPHAELADLILKESGYIGMWKADKSIESEGRLENLRELVSAMAEYESLPEFLEHVALVMDAQNNDTQDKITIMTFHGAKGLEFDCVFLTGWEEGLFPSQRTLDENGQNGLEEERRLAYVGITRAREKAMITHAANRRTYGNWVNNIPSRFIGELPEDVIETSSDVQARSNHWDSSGHKPAPRTFIQTQETANGFALGGRVQHGTFGYGKIINIDGNKLDIVFDRAGRKRVLENFVEAV